MELFRLVTVHPALVHSPLGLTPLIVIAYGVAAWRKSERWTFVGDAALALAAGMTLIASAMGVVSFVALEWSPGMGPWRWIHLGTGAASTTLLAGMAVYRYRRYRARPRQLLVGGRTFGVALLTNLIILGTGWVGGEILVYKAGMAVRAAADGALAPPLGTQTHSPADFDQAMGFIRAHWASATTRRADMLVNRPTREGFMAIAADARAIEHLARWVVEHGAEEADEHAGAGHDHAATPEPMLEMTPEVPPEATPEATPERFISLATMLGEHAGTLAQAARGNDLESVIRAMGQLESTCATCHQTFRWHQGRD